MREQVELKIKEFREGDNALLASLARQIKDDFVMAIPTDADSEWHHQLIPILDGTSAESAENGLIRILIAQYVIEQSQADSKIPVRFNSWYCPRVMSGNPNEGEKKEVTDRKTILFIANGEGFKFGYCSDNGEYTEKTIRAREYPQLINILRKSMAGQNIPTCDLRRIDEYLRLEKLTLIDPIPVRLNAEVGSHFSDIPTATLKGECLKIGRFLNILVQNYFFGKTPEKPTLRRSESGTSLDHARGSESKDDDKPYLEGKAQDVLLDALEAIIKKMNNEKWGAGYKERWISGVGTDKLRVLNKIKVFLNESESLEGDKLLTLRTAPCLLAKIH